MNYHDLHYLLLLGFNRSNKAIVSKTSLEGLMPGQPKILSYLIQHNQCRQKDLATYYNIEPATVSRLLANMEEKGLVQRESRQGDKRSATVAITKKGEQVFARMQVHFAKIEKQELDGFSKEEEALLRSLLQRMYRNLTGEELE